MIDAYHSPGGFKDFVYISTGWNGSNLLGEMDPI